MTRLPVAWQGALPVLDTLDTPLWVFDLVRHAMVWANRAALALWDVETLEALQGRDFTPQTQATRQRLERYRQLLGAGRSIVEAWTFYPEDRPTAWECCCAALDPETPHLMRVEARCTVLAAETLRTLEAFRHVTEPVSLYDAAGRVLLRNPAAHALLPPADTAEDAFAALFADASEAQACRGLLQGQQQATVAADLLLPEGPVRHQLLLTALADPVTGTAAMLVCHHDLGPQQRLLQLEAKKTEELQRLIDTLPLAMVISEAGSGQMVYANRLALTQYGLDESALQRGRLNGAAFYADPAVRQGYMARVVREGVVHGLETVMRDGHGNVYPVLINGYRLEYQGMPCVLSSVVSLAEIKAREDALEEALATERTLRDMQQRFISMVSHEYRTPLSLIDGIAQKLCRHPQQFQGEALVARAGRIREVVRDMLRLGERVLTLSRVEAGGIVPHWQAVRLLPLLTDIVEAQEEIHGDCHIQLTMSEGLPADIEGDPELLHLVFANLVSNAVKYSPDWKKVDIACYPAPGGVSVTVRDWGVGIPKAELPNLFARFFRASSSRGLPGTGLGLHLARELILLHGGRISVESEEGKGTIFIVFLPRRQPGSTAAKP